MSSTMNCRLRTTGLQRKLDHWIWQIGRKISSCTHCKSILIGSEALLIGGHSDPPKSKRETDPLEPRNDLLNTGDWLKDIIWDATRVSPELVDDQEGIEIKRSALAVDEAATNVKDPYNVSNDNLYEHSREARFRIRQTFGAIEVFHSQPAKSLQMPFVS